MRIILDEIDGATYGDIIISSREYRRLLRQEIVDGEGSLKKRKFYLGISLKGDENDEDERTTED